MFDKTRLPHYIDSIHPNSDYHHGQIQPARAVKTYQVSRANRQDSKGDDGSQTSYKHAPDLAYFADSFYVHYLVNPEDEHSGMGQSILARSTNGRDWNDFQISFPGYLIPEATITDYKGNTHQFDGTTYAYMHQRMAFYQSPETGRMLLSGFYGWSPDKTKVNWDHYGIGRVVRELYPDGRMGEIYFITVNWQAGWSAEQLRYPLYTESGDEGFIFLCKTLLQDRLSTQQWAEENGDQSDLIQIKHPENGTYQAFTWYHIDADRVIGLWKHALVAASEDGGQTWSTPERSPSLVMSGQKVWAERTSDGRFAMVYNPTLETQHRYPLCVTRSEDGLAYSQMRLVHGEVPPMRYKGFWKDLGPQYVRGISEGHDLPPDQNLWVTYSLNKEDIWVSSIPIPLRDESADRIDEHFDSPHCFDQWNIYAPKWAPVECHLPSSSASSVSSASAGESHPLTSTVSTEPIVAAAAVGLVATKPVEENAVADSTSLVDSTTLAEDALYRIASDFSDARAGFLRLRDFDPYDYARVERMLLPRKRLELKLRLRLHQVAESNLQIELLNHSGIVGLRLVFRPDGQIYLRTVTEIAVLPYEANRDYELDFRVDCELMQYSLAVNGDLIRDERGAVRQFLFMSALNEISRLSIRSGDARHAESLDYDPEGKPEQALPLASIPAPEAVYDIKSLQVEYR